MVVVKVIDIRGTHGSGKSYLVRQLMRWHGEPVDVMDSDDQGRPEHIGYSLSGIDCAVVARYTDTGGGCDGVKTPDEVVRRVRMFAQLYRVVVLEGILVAHTYKRYADLADELGRDNYTFMFLDTPHAKCVSRVKARRAEKGNDKTLDTYWLDYDYQRITVRFQEQFARDGYRVKRLDHRQPLHGLLEEINSAANP